MIASSSVRRSGANPPSSPTPVPSLRLTSTFLSAWNTSAPICTASENVSAPTGTIMNSWKSTVFVACAPPFTMFIIGTGSTRESGPPRYRYSGTPSDSAPARALASDTARMALAPRLALFGVPSSSIMAASMAIWSVASMPRSFGAIVFSTFCTARRTPLPRYRSLSPSRNSIASCSPVLAPLGTAARPVVPSDRITSASMVGLPRLSRISRALMRSIVVMKC